MAKPEKNRKISLLFLLIVGASTPLLIWISIKLLMLPVAPAGYLETMAVIGIAFVLAAGGRGCLDHGLRGAVSGAFAGVVFFTATMALAESLEWLYWYLWDVSPVGEVFALQETAEEKKMEFPLFSRLPSLARIE